MFYPLQVPSLLDQAFIKQIEYKEYKKESLKQYIMCIWSMHSFQCLESTVNNVILPDGCIDLIIDFSKKEVYFSASSKASWNYSLLDNVDYMGVRIRPGAFYNLYKYDCAKVMDKKISFNEIETNYDLSEVLCLTTTKERLLYIEKYFDLKIKSSTIDNFTLTLNNTDIMSDVKYVNEVASVLGYSSRQLNRVFKKQCGVSVKTFLNIIRLHKALHILINEKGNTLIEIANASGFYDEAHFIKEIEKYCGISPTKLVNRYREMA